MTTRRVAWGIWGVTLALLAVWPFLGHAAGTFQGDQLFYFVVPIAIIPYATVGALIMSRHPENRIGLILACVALAFAIAVTAGDYATLAVRRPEPLPLAAWVAWLGRVAFALWLAPLPLLFLLYPDGRVGSPRWRPVLWVLLGALGINLSLFALTPGPLEVGFGELGHAISNPIGLPLAWRTPIEAATEIAGFVALVCAGLAGLSLVLRFRRSSGVERQQIRWLEYVGTILVVVPLLSILIALVRDLLGVNVTEDNDIVGTATWIGFFAVLMFGVPAACAIAILRYRLYEIDVVIKKTVVFGILVLLIMVASIGLILFATGPLTGLAANDTQAAGFVGGVLGLLVWPLYRISRRIADRLVYRGRSSSYEVLTEFGGRMSVAYASDDVLPRLAAVLGEGTGASRAVVWLQIGNDLRPEGTWPPSADAPSTLPDDAVPVTHQGEPLGALSVVMPANDPMNPTKERIVRDLASQAGLVLRNARLIEELRESRRRIVTAQDERARKLERNIHDGAQQQLVALTVKVGLVERLMRSDRDKATAMLGEVKSEANDALENLRDLARGIYPPLLADQGLAAALGAQGRKVPIPVAVEPDGIGRYPEETEAAVYFSCLEALQNVTKYAEASKATVRLAQANGTLSFEVSDDGRGFDPAVVGHGTGLQGIADRLASLGGELEVRSAPGEGTTIAGRLPVMEERR